jgi:phosphoglycolate phosphatase
MTDLGGRLPSIRNVIFDLDGTLVNSLPGISASAAYAIKTVLPERSLPDLASLVGPPIAVMFARLWPELPATQMESLVAVFRQHYDGEGCLNSEPYPAAAATLEKLRIADLEMFVLTNKPLAPTRRLLEHTQLSGYFRDVICPDSSDPPFQSKSEAAQALAQRHELSPEETLIVGDGIDDMAAANECGFGFIAAAYGYGKAASALPPGAETVKSFFEIALLVLRRETTA